MGHRRAPEGARTGFQKIGVCSQMLSLCQQEHFPAKDLRKFPRLDQQQRLFFAGRRPLTSPLLRNRFLAQACRDGRIISLRPKLRMMPQNSVQDILRLTQRVGHS